MREDLPLKMKRKSTWQRGRSWRSLKEKELAYDPVLALSMCAAGIFSYFVCFFRKCFFFSSWWTLDKCSLSSAPFSVQVRCSQILLIILTLLALPRGVFCHRRPDKKVNRMFVSECLRKNKGRMTHATITRYGIFNTNDNGICWVVLIG